MKIIKDIESTVTSAKEGSTCRARMPTRNGQASKHRGRRVASRTSFFQHIRRRSQHTLFHQTYPIYTSPFYSNSIPLPACPYKQHPFHSINCSPLAPSNLHHLQSHSICILQLLNFKTLYSTISSYRLIYLRSNLRPNPFFNKT